jgi:hypothetical protein
MGKGIVKLGEGNWAVKDGNLLAAKETNGRFKNAEFTVTRGTRATYVGRDGLIKESNLQDTNLVQNSDFEELGDNVLTSTWVPGAGWSVITDGVSCDGSNGNVRQNIEMTDYNGKTFLLTYTLSNVTDSTTLNAKFGGGGNVALTSTEGTHTVYLTNDATVDNFQFTSGGNWAGDITNISLKQVDPNDRWLLGTGWSIEDGKATQDGSGSGSSLQHSNALVVGNTYKIVFDIVERTQGSIEVFAGYPNSNVPIKNTVGTHTLYLQAEGNTHLYFKPSNFIGSIDNVSVQEVKTDTPRIDFTDNTDGHLLLEPESRNLIDYSENLKDGYSTTESSVDLNDAVSPDGTTTANKFNSTATPSSISKTHANSSALFHTVSLFLKKGTIDIVTLSVNGGTPAISASTTVNLTSGTITASSGNGSITPTITNYGNDWYRITASSTSNGNIATPTVLIVNSSTTANGYFYMWGLQFEGLPYATSYIPTNGSTVTRDGETCTGAGEAADFNSEEGVLYAEIAALAEVNQGIAISNGTYDNRILFYFDTDGNIRGYIFVSGNQFQETTSGIDYKSLTKMAIKYSATSTKFYVNGNLIGTEDTSSTMPSVLNQLSLHDGGGGNKFYGRIKAIKVYKETDGIDLATLTS